MYAFYPTKRKARDNQPMAIFDRKSDAEEYARVRTPDWLRNKWHVQRIWVDRKNMEVYTISEHNGYRSRGFKEKIFGKPA